MGNQSTRIPPKVKTGSASVTELRRFRESNSENGLIKDLGIKKSDSNFKNSEPNVSAEFVKGLSAASDDGFTEISAFAGAFGEAGLELGIDVESMEQIARIEQEEQE